LLGNKVEASEAVALAQQFHEDRQLNALEALLGNKVEASEAGALAQQIHSYEELNKLELSLERLFANIGAVNEVEADQTSLGVCDSYFCAYESIGL
jgi:hypothetical protein